MIVIQVEGNIAAGKSTLLNYAKAKLCKNKNLNIKFIDEPISDWMEDESKLFKLYYENQKKYSELFQMNAFFMILQSSLKHKYIKTDIVFIERSIYSSFYCFTKLLLDYGYVSPLFYSILKTALDNFKNEIIYPNIIIYLKTEDDQINILSKRIKTRGRNEEQNIASSYLSNLNLIYDEFINTYFLESMKYIIPINLTEEEQKIKFDVIIENILEKCNQNGK